MESTGRGGRPDTNTGAFVALLSEALNGTSIHTSQNAPVQVCTGAFLFFTNALRELFIEAITKNVFWFKVKAGTTYEPEVPAKPMPCVVNTPVFRGLKIRAQRRDWAKRLF